MKILYVEDDSNIAAVAKHLFLQTDHVLLFCETVASAIHVADCCRESIDVILLDLHLSDGNGMGLIKFIDKENIKIPVIIVSGYCGNHMNDLFVYKKSGIIKDIITKPFTMDEILNQLNEIEKSLID